MVACESETAAACEGAARQARDRWRGKARGRQAWQWKRRCRAGGRRSIGSRPVASTAGPRRKTSGRRPVAARAAVDGADYEATTLAAGARSPARAAVEGAGGTRSAASSRRLHARRQNCKAVNARRHGRPCRLFLKKTRPHGCQLLSSARALTIAKRLGSSRSRVYTGARGYRRRRAGAIFFTYDDRAPGSEGVWVNLSP